MDPRWWSRCLRIVKRAQNTTRPYPHITPTICSSRSLTTTPCRTAIAAPEIDFDKLPPIDNSDIDRARIIPASPSYFTGQPYFTDQLLTLQSLLRKYQTLPTVPPGHAPRVAWRRHAEYKTIVGEPVKAAKYNKIIQVLQRMNYIHPSLMPEEVKRAMGFFKRNVQPNDNPATPVVIDEFGRAAGYGARKSSHAQAWLVEGEGEVLINGQTLAQWFGRVHDRESAIWALKATDRIDKYNVWAVVRGGGLTGQAEALTLAVAKALMVHEPALKPALRRGELLRSRQRAACHSRCFPPFLRRTNMPCSS